jgi:hypothetical protein
MPPVTSTDTIVRVAVLRRLLKGEPVDSGSLSVTTDLPIGTVAEALARLSAAGAISLSNGIVAAAYPLSAAPTRHKVLHDGTTAYACCAVDALAVPSMVEGGATVESRCAHCDQTITVEMRSDRILSSHPETLVVFHVDRDCCDPGPTLLARCPHINFFCGSDHAGRWRAANPGMTGDTLTVDQAVTRAREIFGPVIRLLCKPG